MALERRAHTRPSPARERPLGAWGLTPRRVGGPPRWRGSLGRGPGRSRRGCRFLWEREGRRGGGEAEGAGPGGAAAGADLGGSSKYSNESFEGRSGEGFHVNSSCTWVSRFSAIGARRFGAWGDGDR